MLNVAWSLLETSWGISIGSGPQRLASITIPLENKKTPINQAANQTSQHTEQRPPRDEHRFHEAQVHVARDLFKTVKQMRGYDGVDGVDFRIVVPTRKSLVRQTIERLTCLLWDTMITDTTHQADLAALIKETQAQEGQYSILDTVHRTQPFHSAWRLLDEIHALMETKVMTMCMFPSGQRASQPFLDLCHAIYATHSAEAASTNANPRKKRRKLMVIVHDECHWGIERNHQADIFLNGARHHRSSHAPNAANPLCEPNVVIVHVSATGWNFDVVPHHRVVRWDSWPQGYVSWESYMGNANKLLIASPELEQRVERARSTLLDGRCSSCYVPKHVLKLLPSIVLMVDYALAFLALFASCAAFRSALHEVPLFGPLLPIVPPVV